MHLTAPPCSRDCWWARSRTRPQNPKGGMDVTGHCCIAPSWQVGSLEAAPWPEVHP